jgi:hypothetical protein
VDVGVWVMVFRAILMNISVFLADVLFFLAVSDNFKLQFMFL